MDRPATILPRLAPPLVGLAMAGLPWLIGHPDARSLGGDTAPARVVSADKVFSGRAAGGESAQPGLFCVEGRAERLPAPGAHGQLVSAAAYPSEQEIPHQSTDVPVLELQVPARLSTANELSIRVVREDQALSQPGTDPHPDGTARKTRISVTFEPADALPDQPAEPPAQPKPDSQTEPQQRDATGTDPDRVGQQPGAGAPEGPRPLRKPAGSLLLPPEVSGRRSEQLERIAREADRQIRRGFELAGRGASFAARAQFIKALRLVAQGLDAEHQTVVHSRSLAAGLTAVQEADDFIPTGSRLEADLDISGIIEAHRTPVLKNADTGTLTSMVALKCYFTFAQEQLAAAAGREVAGSVALHALGKLHMALASQTRSNVRAAEPKAMAFYQAALLAYPRNYMAANDLGVLLARCGDYHHAQGALRHSLSIHPQSTGWHNLAAVYRRLGQVALAQQADRLLAAARRAEIARRKAHQNSADQPVRWVDPQTFAQSYPKPPPAPRLTPARLMTTTATRPYQAAPAAQESVVGWLPGNLDKKRK